MKNATTIYVGQKKNAVIKLFGILVLIAVFFVLNIAFGSVFIPFSQVLKVLTGGQIENVSWTNIILNTRLPQIVTSILAGSALGLAGLMMQTLFRNPLAGPSVLGVSAGASLGVAIMMMFITLPGGKFIVLNQVFGNFSVIFSAFAGAFAVLLLMGVLAGRFKSSTIILIIGIMLGYAISAIVGVLQFYSLKEDLQAFVIWGLGSFANVSWDRMGFFAAIIVFGILLSIMLTKPLNALLLGENYAQNLGINLKKSRILIIVSTGLLTAAVTAYCGPIAFIGLAVPHLSRNLFKTSDHLINIPGVILTGALLALFCNLIARLPGFDGALPINAITSIIGAPVVIWIIVRRNEFRVQS